MLALVPKTRVISESFPITYINTLINKRQVAHEEEHKKLLQSALRLMCKIESHEEIDYLVVKLSSMNTWQIPLLVQIMPDNMKFIFNTRHPKPTIRSYCQLLDNQIHGIYGISPFSYRAWILGMPYPLDHGHKLAWLRQEYDVWWPMRMEETFVANYALGIASYLEYKTIYSEIIFYEEIVEDAGIVLERLFRLLGIDMKYKKHCLKALAQDSQNETFGKRGEFQLEESKYQFYNQVFQTMDMNELDVDMSVDDFKRVFDTKKLNE